MKKKLIKTVKQLLAFIPRTLPTGMTEFQKLVSDLKETYDLPTISDDDIYNALAAMIINGPALLIKRPLRYFYLAFVAGAQKQVAGAVFTEVKYRVKQRREDEKKAAADATEKTNAS